MIRICFRNFITSFAALFCVLPALAHDRQGTAHAQYIANEGVLVSSGDVKIMFDPLPLSGLGTYMNVPDQDRADMMAGLPPYDGIDAVFISHAHRDHFSAGDMIAYMQSNTDVHIVMPRQALQMMRGDTGWDAGLLGRISALDMAAGDPSQTLDLGAVSASAVRIPHAGWPAPARAAVQNMVYRVTLSPSEAPVQGVTVMHMGDADVNPRHYAPHQAHWDAARTDTAFPPYWFFLYPGGADILYHTMNVDQAIGTHVPLRVPAELKASGADYFSISGETRAISSTHKPD